MTTASVHAQKWKLALSLFWFLFTFSLVTWWWIFSLHQLQLMKEVFDASKFNGLHRMLLWEGAVLVSAVFFGGLSLVILTNRELSRNQRLRSFFSNFTHDLKTSITRLRLRTEVLTEKLEGPEFEKLIMEVNRLDLQLENSLWVARSGSEKLVLQEQRLSTILAFLRVEWPELEIRLHQDVEILADGQALKSIFRNLFQNSYLHGQATCVDIRPELRQNFWVITVSDNGKGFKGKHHELGSQLLSTRSEKGNGLGLYLTRDLLQRMNGEIAFTDQSANGFTVSLSLRAVEEQNA